MRLELEHLVKVEPAAALVMAEEGLEVLAREQTHLQQRHLSLFPPNEQTEAIFIAVRTQLPLKTQITPPITLLVILRDIHLQSPLHILLRLLWLLLLPLLLRNLLLLLYGTHSRVESRMILHQCLRSTTRPILYSRILSIGLHLLLRIPHLPRRTARHL